MAESSSDEVGDKDKILLVIGNWERADAGIWHFVTKGDQEKVWIQLFSEMTMVELVLAVRKALDIVRAETYVKLTYQYPEWLSVEEGNGTPPQYISTDDDVNLFIQMRRQLEEVNLFVTIVNGSNNRTTISDKMVRLHRRVTRREWDDEESGSDSSSESDDDWHDFALDLTQPERQVARSLLPEFNATIQSASIPSEEAIITTPSPAPIISLSSPVADNKDKGKAPVIEVGDNSMSNPSHIDIRSLNPLFTTNQPIPTESSREGTSKRNHMTTALMDQEESTQDDCRQQFKRITLWGAPEQALSEFLNDKSDNPALFMRDAPPVFDDFEIDGIDAALDDIQYEGDKIFVGRVFKSKQECKIKIAIHAINQKFHFRTTRSNPRFMVLKCVSEDCPWSVYASIIDNSENFQIRQATLIHTCTVDERLNYHRLATTQVIGELMASRYVGIKTGPRPAEIRKLLLDEYHINISYWKSWRGRERAMDHALGSVAGSYALLPTYLQLLEQNNPGSLSYIEFENLADGSRRFKYCFLAFAAAINGFQWVRKVIVVDGTSLKSRYGGCLVSACCQDANFQIFPLAYGIVDSENDTAWEWFFKKLNSFVPDSTDLVFISDRHASIYNGLRQVYIAAGHSACTIHLYRNIKVQYKPKRVAVLMSKAARYYTVQEFNRYFAEIQHLNPACAEYLVNIGFDHWARCHFKGSRYNIMDSNIAESWNKVIKEAREFPLICMLEYIRTQVMSWFATRRSKAMAAPGFVTPKVREHIEENYNASTAFAIRPISNYEFEVQSRTGCSFIVNLDNKTCTCREYQLIGIPCSHTLSVACLMNVPTDAMVNHLYYVEAWKNAYVEKIYPIPSVGGLPLGGLEAFATIETRPPKTRRPPGRPRKLRINSQGEFKRKQSATKRRCSRCLGVGHNKASCRNGIEG